jgi:hypothetical protein
VLIVPDLRDRSSQNDQSHAHHAGCPRCLTTWEYPTEAAARQGIIDHAFKIHSVLIDPVKIPAESCPVCLGMAA